VAILSNHLLEHGASLNLSFSSEANPNHIVDEAISSSAPKTTLREFLIDVRLGVFTRNSIPSPELYVFAVQYPPACQTVIIIHTATFDGFECSSVITFLIG